MSFEVNTWCISAKLVSLHQLFKNVMSLEWLLEDTFSNLDRGFLLESRTRQHLVDYFNTVIDEFRSKNEDNSGQTECKLVVQAAINFHEESKNGNNGVCLFGKYHNILYVVAKLCFLWHLKDNEIASTLLTCIYECENTFEKFFECAIFGTKVTQLISGWRSDYRTPDENLKASIYFLKHAVEGKLTFKCKNKRRNFVDVPMNCYENLSPLKTAVKAEKWDLVILLMKYGALTHVSPVDDDCEKYSIFNLFVQKLQKFDENFARYEAKVSILEGFKVFIRSIPNIWDVWKLENDDDVNTRPVLLSFLTELFIKDVEEPRTLKHLARCAVRHYLTESHQLPANDVELTIPEILIRYLNLETD